MSDVAAGKSDSYLKCTVCGRESTTTFASSLRTGWEKCCGYTMRLVRTDADIDAAVRGTAMGPGMFDPPKREPLPPVNEHGYGMPTWEQALVEAFDGIAHAYERRRQLVIAAHEAGLSYHTIARAVGMSATAIHKIAGGSKGSRSQADLLRSQAGLTRHIADDKESQ